MSASVGGTGTIVYLFGGVEKIVKGTFRICDMDTLEVIECGQ